MCAGKEVDMTDNVDMRIKLLEERERDLERDSERG